MLSYIYYLRYPQFNWAKEIFNVIQEHKLLNSSTEIIDMPSGDGIISYWLQNKIKKNNFILLDIDLRQNTLSHQHLFKKRNHINIQSNLDEFKF